jgi:hypothetical protein
MTFTVSQQVLEGGFECSSGLCGLFDSRQREWGNL